jgi:hypothetical protein
MTRDVFRSPASILGANAVQQYDDEAVVYAAHQHGYTFREGLGYLADAPDCAGCCEAATAAWKAAWRRPGEVWDGSVPPGGYVCAACGTPTESEPCVDHMAEALLTPDSPNLPDDTTEPRS